MIAYNHDDDYTYYLVDGVIAAKNKENIDETLKLCTKIFNIYKEAFSPKIEQDSNGQITSYPTEWILTNFYDENKKEYYAYVRFHTDLMLFDKETKKEVIKRFRKIPGITEISLDFYTVTQENDGDIYIG